MRTRAITCTYDKHMAFCNGGGSEDPVAARAVFGATAINITILAQLLDQDPALKSMLVKKLRTGLARL